MTYQVMFSKAAQKDAEKIKNSNLAVKCKELIAVLKADPFTIIPPFEKLIGDLDGFYSRRINVQHRLVYSIDQKNRIIRVLRMWTHYQ
ncbi:Txe/YoeB family addiction module toxin [Rickettsiales endosymbiont of Peranema trichophorum]|uniref:Txe/YoeB family addiction module toxin n=1 Tax=Rickettsiales endosymbiont of Peranema trichophorum TaxID=2486577 RepID=UPI00102321C1|nr:Txe/YoeB family addiction module toxin [Rickettsiales endosymbiont of Peranema trichophorum]RZI47261.1 Txe/YoeB family addiction module toxin [Rickettsiales endosymbiont of Peranema trichophorum]